MNFKIEGNKFVKDGKEIKLISGAVHYFRNMKDTWRDIFKKMRAMGLNCVETYCAWNMHEKQPDVFDFTGNYRPRSSSTRTTSMSLPIMGPQWTTRPRQMRSGLLQS